MSQTDVPGIGEPASQALAHSVEPSGNGTWVDLDASFLHHLSQITIADPVLAVPAHAQQNDLDRKAAALEQGQQDGSSTGRPSLNCQS
jgi:hypothetical protein